MEEPIYLDHNATTPVDGRVLEKMLPYFCEVYGNASSSDHIHGNRAKQAVDGARQAIGKVLGCRKESEIVFTSGATEANNLALIGAFRKFRDKGNHVISTAIEHPAVLDTCHEKIDVYDMNIDLLSFSAHKFYGPKGVGGLFVRSYSPLIKLSPISYGGGHEKGMRSGTLNVPGIVGMAEALFLANKEMAAENKRLREAAELICKRLQLAFPDIKLNGHPQNRLAHNLSLAIPGVEAKALIHRLKNKLSFSAGSACSTVKVEPSHVLKAVGLSDDETFQTIRLGLGRATQNPEQIADCIIEGISRLRN